MKAIVQVEGLLSFLYTGACSLSPDRADILNILQVSDLLDYLCFLFFFIFLILSYYLIVACLCDHKLSKPE